MTPPSHRALRDLSLFFLAAFAALALVTGYHALVARAALTARPDNPRALIAYDRIQRGRILDRNGAPLADTTGQPGDYARRYEPSAAHALGYASFRYGLSGIELAAEATLVGTQGRSNIDLWFAHDLLGQPVIGRDVRLTLDLPLQRLAASALDAARHPGAVVVVDTSSGDLLALASAPTFDPARLDADFDSITADSNGPLIDRAILARYSAGLLLNLFPSGLDLTAPPLYGRTAVRPDEPPDGQRITPLHMALLTAAVAANGQMPAPRLIAAEQTPTGWSDRPAEGHPLAIMPPDAAAKLRQLFAARPTLPGYSATMGTGQGNHTVGWFIGFTPDGSAAFAIALEDATGDDAAAAAGFLIK